MNPLKIGILLNPSRALRDYEARLFYDLLNDSRYEVVCTIKDGRNVVAKTSVPRRIANAILDGRLFRTLLIRIIQFVESPLLKAGNELPYEMAQVGAELSALPCIEMTPKREGSRDCFSTSDCAELEQLKLDVLLQHEFKSIKGEILKIPTYGIWSIHHGDNDVNRGGPTGFWEVYNKDSVTGITLQVLEDELDGGRVIQKGIYNTANYWCVNNENIIENSNVIILKHLRLLYEDRNLRTAPNGIYSNKLYRSPSFFEALNYILRKYPRLLFRNLWRLIRNGSRVDSSEKVWKLHIGIGCIENAVLWRSKTSEPPSDEFWADPYLFEHNNRTYVFFENYEYSKRKGKISAGIIEEGQVVDVSDCLNTDYHLSYPFIFEHNKEIYMIPETFAMKRLEIWKCDDFPNKWSLERTRFEGVPLADSTIVKDPKNQHWLFTNISYGKIIDHTCHLYVYRIDSPMMNDVIPHRLNPVITDCRSARSGGNFYTDNSGRMIRPSQASQNGVYGQCLNLCHVKELTIDSYDEEVLEIVTPDFKDGMYSVHHLSQGDGIFVIDGRYRKR